MKVLLSLMALTAVFGIQAGSISVSQEQKAGPALTGEDKAQAIAAFIRDFKDNYVFPDLADKASQVLKHHLDHGDYDTITAGPEFAAAVTKQVHEICLDAHLRFFYSPEVLPIRKLDSKPTPEEDKAFAHNVQVRNSGFEHVERLDGNLGYLEVRGFPDANAAKELSAAALTFLANTDALILDLRRNGGGDPEAVKNLLSYFFDKRTHLNDIYLRDGNRTQEFWTTARVHGKKYLNKDVYVLTSSRTGSGAEECAYDLQCLHRATLIGTSTWGGANPGDFFRLTDHFRAFIPSGRAINPYTKKNWEGTGVIPDVKVDADKALDVAKKMALEKLIASAKSGDKERFQNALDSLTHPKN